MTIAKTILKALFLAGIVFLIATSCSEEKQKGPAITSPTRVDTVNVFVARMDSVQKTVSLPGELLPFENVLIRAKVQGYISKIRVDIGSKVNKGEVLALIDAPEINSRVQELRAKEKAAESRYLASKDYYDRIRSASQSDGVIAATELDKTKNQMQADEAEYRAAQSAVSSNRQIGNYLAIVAPYSGIVTKRNIDVGSFVGSTNEKPLFEIEDNKVLRLQISVPEIYSNADISQNTGEITTRSLPDKKFIAKLVRRSGSINNSTRSEIWEFEVPNPARELKAGSYADVKLHFSRKKQSIMLPVSAIVTTLEKRFIIKVSGNTTQWIDVRPGFNMGDKQEIFGDVAAGDTIVVRGNEELKAGTKVVSKIAN
jgi:membrane fusion protein, multidrug efflux system